jgi:hypothetical protein
MRSAFTFTDFDLVLRDAKVRNLVVSYELVGASTIELS